MAQAREQDIHRVHQSTDETGDHQMNPSDFLQTHGGVSTSNEVGRQGKPLFSTQITTQNTSHSQDLGKCSSCRTQPKVKGFNYCQPCAQEKLRLAAENQNAAAVAARDVNKEVIQDLKQASIDSLTLEERKMLAELLPVFVRDDGKEMLAMIRGYVMSKHPKNKHRKIEELCAKLIHLHYGYKVPAILVTDKQWMTPMTLKPELEDAARRLAAVHDQHVNYLENGTRMLMRVLSEVPDALRSVKNVEASICEKVGSAYNKIQRRKLKKDGEPVIEESDHNDEDLDNRLDYEEKLNDEDEVGHEQQMNSHSVSPSGHPTQSTAQYAAVPTAQLLQTASPTGASASTYNLQSTNVAEQQIIAASPAAPTTPAINSYLGVSNSDDYQESNTVAVTKSTVQNRSTETQPPLRQASTAASPAVSTICSITNSSYSDLQLKPVDSPEEKTFPTTDKRSESEIPRDITPELKSPKKKAKVHYPVQRKVHHAANPVYQDAEKNLISTSTYRSQGQEIISESVMVPIAKGSPPFYAKQISGFVPGVTRLEIKDPNKVIDLLDKRLESVPSSQEFKLQSCRGDLWSPDIMKNEELYCNTPSDSLIKTTHTSTIPKTFADLEDANTSTGLHDQSVRGREAMLSTEVQIQEGKGVKRECTEIGGPQINHKAPNLAKKMIMDNGGSRVRFGHNGPVDPVFGGGSPTLEHFSFQSVKDPKADSLNILYQMDDSHERRTWLDSLFRFMKTKGTSMKGLPAVSKKTVDLFRLYQLTKERGGYHACVKNKSWKVITEQLGITYTTNSTFLLKKHYDKYLLPYEIEVDNCGLDAATAQIQSQALQEKVSVKKEPSVTSAADIF